MIVTSVEARNFIEIIELSLQTCLNTKQSTMEQIECYSNAEQDWDMELNRIYKLLQNKLKPSAQDISKTYPIKQQEALKESQRGWITQRDKEFKLIQASYEYLHGTVWSIEIAHQRANVVKERVLLLQNYLDARESYLEMTK